MDVPQIIAGRFRIECEIGTGGMGTVYRATHLGLERPVAVKIIKPEFAFDPDVADRFMREARTMAKLRHPHAAMIFDAGNLPDGRHFIIMEFVEGQTLSEILQAEGRLSPERAVRIAADICDVLAEAHSLGIVHRDLKPSNIMLNERGVCVLDFGVAKVLATSADATHTHATTGSGVIVGTPRYMSPEQCLGQRIGARSDLYSLGVLLYEMLAGRPPFTDPLASAVLVKQATAPPPPLPKLREDIPRALVVAVHTLLAKRPEDRPQNAGAAQKLLEKSIVRPARILHESQPFSSTVAALNTKRSVLFRAATPLAMIAVLGLGFLAWGRGAQTSTTPGENAQAATKPATASLDSSFSGAPLQKVATSAPLSLDAARHLVSSASHGDEISDVRVIKTDSNQNQAIVAIHDERGRGTSHLFVMESHGKRYRVTSRAPLDVPDFRGASWTAENRDIDGDGYDEVLYTGTNAKGHASGYRLVLYVPRTRQTYSLRVENQPHNSKKLRATFSPNTMTRTGAPYRAALQQRARAAIATF
ncbi:MAG: eukaryotic-like serine/threonine-protein kinase [Acidobacteriota bacterium]|jgi:serine/threonine-protein kinase|nr:eukaryotic-like serine/threonine-protein kinase [Acidobacteriota bacterium]